MRDLEIFGQAIEIQDSDKRRRFVDAACGTDAELRAEIIRLLAAYEQADSILEHPVVPDHAAERLLSCTASGPPEDNGNPLATPAPRDREGTNVPTGTERSIGPYRLLELIGEGGFGLVFVAEQSKPLHRKVALKVIKPGMDSKEVIARFTAERQALALMDHPNIATVFDGGTTSRGLPFFVMELVRGVPITRYCDETKCDMPERLRLFLDACKAIHHAHQKGIIHRDIKPSNVMVTLHDGEPVVKVIDFGVAKALNQRLTDMTVYTRYSFMIGTPSYMSPEQAGLSGLDVDTRSDIYSLGVLLYELITGSPPFSPDRFTRATIDEMRRIIRDEEPPKPSVRISHLGPESTSVAQLRRTDPTKLETLLRGDLDLIVMKALSKDRAQRYETAIGLAHDVGRYLAGDVVTARPPSWRYVTSRFMRRHRGLVLATGLVLGVLLLGIATSLSLAVWAFRERAAAKAQEARAMQKSEEAREAARAAASAEQKALQGLLASRIAFANLNILSGRPGQQHESLDAIRDAVELAKQAGTLAIHEVELRSQAIAALTRLDLVLTHRLPTSTMNHRVFATSGDLRTYAIRVQDGDEASISVRTISNPDEERLRIPVPYDARTNFHDIINMRMSPNGRYLAIFGEVHPMVVWDLQQNRPVIELPSVLGINTVNFSSDSRYLPIVEHGGSRKDNKLHLYSLPSGARERTFPTPVRRWAILSPDSQFLAASTLDGLTIHEVESGSVVAELHFPNDGLDHAIAWSQSGDLIAATTHHEIWIWDVPAAIAESRERLVGGARETPEARQAMEPFTILRGHEGPIDWIEFHPHHESLLASSGWDRTTRFWNVLSGEPQLTIAGSKPKFSSDGRQVAIAHDAALEIHELAVGSACRWLYGRGQLQVAFDPHGRWVATSSKYHGCRVWGLPSLRLLGQLSSAKAQGLATDVANDGLLIGNEYGLFMLPVAETRSSALRIGPARRLLSRPYTDFGNLHNSVDGKWLFCSDYYGWGTLLLDRPSGNAIVRLQPYRSQFLSVSPNGRWTAVSLASKVVVQDTKSARTVAEFESSSVAGLSFSRDSRLLAIAATDNCRLIETETWSVIGKVTPSSLISEPGFDPDANFIVVPVESGQMAIVRIEDQLPVAKLNYGVPMQVFSTAMYSNEGRYLMVTDETQGATLWDLGFIREQLAELGLDWSASPLPTHAASGDEIASLEFESGDIGFLADLWESTRTLTPAELRDEITQQIRQGVEFPDSYRFRALACAEMGDLAAACEDWRAARERAPYAMHWRWSLATTLWRMGDYQSAYDEFWDLSDPDSYYQATDAVFYVGWLAFARPEVIRDASALRRKLSIWRTALRREDKKSHEGMASGRLSGQNRTAFGEALGLGFLALDDREAAAELLDAYRTESLIGCLGRSHLAALVGNEAAAAELQEQALSSLAALEPDERERSRALLENRLPSDGDGHEGR